MNAFSLMLGFMSVAGHAGWAAAGIIEVRRWRNPVAVAICAECSEFLVWSQASGFDASLVVQPCSASRQSPMRLCLFSSSRYRGRAGSPNIDSKLLCRNSDRPPGSSLRNVIIRTPGSDFGKR